MIGGKENGAGYCATSVSIKYNIIEKWLLENNNNNKTVRRGQCTVTIRCLLLYAYNITKKKKNSLLSQNVCIFSYEWADVRDDAVGDRSVKPRPHTFRSVFYRPVRVAGIRKYYDNSRRTVGAGPYSSKNEMPFFSAFDLSSNVLRRSNLVAVAAAERTELLYYFLLFFFFVLTSPYYNYFYWDSPTWRLFLQTISCI